MSCKPSNFFLNTTNATLNFNDIQEISTNTFKSTIQFSILNQTLTSPKIWIKLCKEPTPHYTNNINQLNINIQKCLIQLCIKSINENGENISETLFINNYKNAFYQKTGNQYFLTLEIISNTPFDIYKLYNIPTNNIVYCYISAIYS